MLAKFIRRHFNVLFFMFSSAFTGGIILVGVLSSLSVMLVERGFSASQIAIIPLATIPYSLRFIISPFVKNIIDKSPSTVKMLAYVAQTLLIILLSMFGVFWEYPSLLVITVTVFILTVTVTVHDILGDYVRLTCFNKKSLGLATSICTVGFRIGMFVSGAGILYLAAMFNWKVAFVITGSTILISSLSTTFLPEIGNKGERNAQEVKSIQDYLKFFIDIFKKPNIWIIILLIFVFKFSDSCINILKISFLLQYISKVVFANISDIPGMFAVIFGGITAGVATYRVGTKQCVKISFVLQIIASFCFVILAHYKLNLFSIAIFINIATFLFGFSAVIFRAYISEISDSNINTYTVLLSIGSLVRVVSPSIGGVIADDYSWMALYLICAASNIPGLYAYIKISGRQKI